MILTYKGLKIEVPYDAIEVEDIDILQPINDHCYLKLKLLIEEGKILEYINKDVSQEKITVIRYSEDENQSEETKLFRGKINEVHMLYEGGLHIMELQCVSYTKDFDIKKNSRTFCNLDMTYEDVINKVLEPYEKKNFTDNITNGQAIGEFILQYEETDWEFLKRIASHFNGVLLSECTEDYGRFHFGIPEINNSQEMDLDEYEVIKDIDNYNKREAIQFEDNFLQEYTKWDIVSPKKLLLGEEVIFNKVRCVIAKIHIEVYKEEIRTIYTIGLKRGLRSTYKVNRNIFGMSIPAIVKDVKGNTMSVHFEIDPVYEVYQNQKYFTYAIESSAWYCMPEKESKVHIYFSTNDEKDAIAIHAVRAQGGDAKYAGRTQNPDNKSFSNVTGSEMKLTPSDMSFAADDSRTVCLTLGQSGDVSLIGKNMNFTAAENLQLGMREGDGDAPSVRPQNIEISAKSKIEMSKGGTIGIQMVDETFLQGSIIKYEGTIKDAVEMPATVTEWENTDVQAQKDQMNAGALEYEKAKIEEAKSKVSDGLFVAALGIAAIVAGVLTGGLALGAFMLVCGALGTAIGGSQVAEGIQDYKKVQSGDYSKSYNFMRDKVCGGNQGVYNAIKWTTTIINGIAVAWVTGGGSMEVLASLGKGALVDGSVSAGFGLVSDFLDDGKINNGVESYGDLISKSIAMGSLSRGFANRKANATSEKTGGPPKNTNTKEITDKSSQKYIENKKCILDPIDSVTGSLYVPATDIVLPDIHEEFKVERKYESLNKDVSVFGKGWKPNFDSFLDIEDEKIKVLCEDGHVETFNKVDGDWVNDKGGARIYILHKEKTIGFLNLIKIKKLINMIIQESF